MEGKISLGEKKKLGKKKAKNGQRNLRLQNELNEIKEYTEKLKKKKKKKRRIKRHFSNKLLFLKIKWTCLKRGT